MTLLPSNLPPPGDALLRPSPRRRVRSSVQSHPPGRGGLRNSALSSGMKGLAIRIVKRMNKLWERRGAVFADRYHMRILGSPKEVRNALRYVIQNAKHHGVEVGDIDPYSSGPWFTGWLDQQPFSRPGPMARARTWLLRWGWQTISGPLSVTCRPA